MCKQLFGLNYLCQIRVIDLKFVILLSFVVIMLCSTNVFAEPFVHLSKYSYNYGETIRVSGNVDYQQGMPIIIQLRSTSDIVAIEQSFPSPSGSFVTVFVAEGPKWKEGGTYTVLVSYQGQKIEKSFQFTSQEQKPLETIKQEPIQSQKPKITIKDFPDPTNSPQEYFDQYKNDQDFKKWFEATFVGYNIEDIVGYKVTHIADFPDPRHSPQYYIDRYNKEERFKQWFDSQFPQKTIYDIVGVTEQIRTLMPAWVKQYAVMWSNDEIDDKRFIDGISSLIKQGIIVINEDVNHNNQDKTIPIWVKRSASWYGQNMITEDDFLAGIQYLVERGFIVV